MYSKMSTNMAVQDVGETVRFYVDTLGFTFVMSVPQNSEEILTDWTPGHDLVYALVSAGGIEMMFQKKSSFQEHVPAVSCEPVGGSLTFYFYVEDIESLRKNLDGKVEIVKDLHTTFYGMSEFYIRDCNGYILGFAKQKS